VLPLLWLTSPSFREFLRRKGLIISRRSLWVFLRILGKHGAIELGFLLPIVMLVPAIIAAGMFQTLNAFLGGAAFGFALLTLVPVAMPMPSRELEDAAAAGKRFI
jgi:hypothetical protein